MPKNLAALAGTALALSLAAYPAAAWTPTSQKLIAEAAARLAPPDLYRQLARHRGAFLQGATDPFNDQQPDLHFQNADGSGRLAAVIEQSLKNTVAAIRAHRPFQEVSWRLGVLSHYLAEAYYPLNCSDSDPEEKRYFADFRLYLESVEPRLEIVFYGFRPDFSGARDFSALIDDTLARSRDLYPLVGREYRRVGFKPGRLAFDDRSTAYALASLSYSHAVSDIAEVLRYIWTEAGGIDTRSQLPLRGRHVITLPRASVRR